MVVLNKVLSMVQIELFDIYTECEQMTFIYLWVKNVWYSKCAQMNDLCWIELLEIERFDHLCAKEWA